MRSLFVKIHVQQVNYRLFNCCNSQSIHMILILFLWILISRLVFTGKAYCYDSFIQREGQLRQEPVNIQIFMIVTQKHGNTHKVLIFTLLRQLFQINWFVSIKKTSIISDKLAELYHPKVIISKLIIICSATMKRCCYYAPGFKFLNEINKICYIECTSW